MKRLAIIILMASSLNACAQKNEYFNADSGQLVFRTPPLTKDRPIILIDEKEYNGKLEDIKQSEIISVSIVKKIDAIKLYGPKRGANGVVMIATKQSLTSAPENIVLEPLPGKNIEEDKIILDGKAIDKQLRDIDFTQVAKVTVLNTPQEVGSDRTLKTYLVVTKNFAVLEYQKKLSSFSKDYKNYLESCKCNDLRFLYVVNGVSLKQDDNLKMIEKLYDLQPKAIKSVTFMDKNYKNAFYNREPIVLITTKIN